MNTKDLALEFELMMMPSERSGLELASSDFDLVRHQVAECILADFVDFRGVSNPKRWASNQCAAPAQVPYECTYLEYPSCQDPSSDVDDCASENSISESDLEDY